jgi:hypothetical protein
VAPTSGDPVCQGGACTFTCPLDAGADAGGPFVLCGSDAGTPGCYNLSSAPQACGACGHACPSGDRCVDGQCCAMGDGICGGVCTPLNTAQNCGACDAGCAAPAMCMAGQCVGYVETTSAAPFVDACAISGSTVFPGLAGQGSWATSAAVTLPITFSFFGTAETKFWLGSEGTLGFGNANGLDFPDDCSGNGPPALLTDYAAIAAFGDDYLVPGKVCYATVGTAPNRQLIASWDQDTYSLGDPSFALNVSIVLSETTNTVDLLYEVPSAASDGGASDAAVDGGGDGGTTVPITDPNIQGSNATIMLQLVNTTRSTLSFCSPFLMSSPFGVHLVP